MKVSNLLDIYEVNGTDVVKVDGPTMEVKSHWNRTSMVVLVLDGKAVTVSAHALEAAIRNAQNTGR
jgi:hypothetical protein